MINMIYILYQSSVFDDAANLIKESLREQGIYAQITYKVENNSESDYYIILGAHILDGPLPYHYEVYQFEQVNSVGVHNWFEGENGERYVKILQGATVVYDYSKLNTELLTQRYQRLEPIFLPLGFNKGISPTRIHNGLHRRTDVVFLGSINKRRTTWLDNFNKSGIIVNTGQNVWRERRQALLRNSKVALNIHFYPNATLETTRVSELLMTGCLIISERSTDKELDKLYEDSKLVIFVDNLEQMIECTKWWLNHKDERQKFCAQAFHTFTHDLLWHFNYPMNGFIRDSAQVQRKGQIDMYPEPDLLQFKEAPTHMSKQGLVMELKPIDDDDLPPVSIVTITRDRPELFQIALANFYRFNYPIEKMEWIIVDDSLTKASFVDKLPDNAKYHWRPSEKPMSIAEKRNLAVELASNEIIVHMDDDDYYYPLSVNARVRLLLENLKKEIYCIGCSSYGIYHLMDNYSFKMNTSHLSEASMCYYKNFWQKQHFEEDPAGGGESIPFLKNRRKYVLTMPYEFNFVAITHGNNVTSALRSLQREDGKKITSNSIYRTLEISSQQLLNHIYRKLSQKHC